MEGKAYAMSTEDGAAQVSTASVRFIDNLSEQEFLKEIARKHSEGLPEQDAHILFGLSKEDQVTKYKRENAIYDGCPNPTYALLYALTGQTFDEGLFSYQNHVWESTAPYPDPRTVTEYDTFLRCNTGKLCFIGDSSGRSYRDHPRIKNLIDEVGGEGFGIGAIAKAYGLNVGNTGKDAIFDDVEGNEDERAAAARKVIEDFIKRDDDSFVMPDIKFNALINGSYGYTSNFQEAWEYLLTFLNENDIAQLVANRDSIKQGTQYLLHGQGIPLTPLRVCAAHRATWMMKFYKDQFKPFDN